MFTRIRIRRECPDCGNQYMNIVVDELERWVECPKCQEERWKEYRAKKGVQSAAGA
jgi:ribosomal protein S27AE